MSEISYAGASIPVREDLPAAHAEAWKRLASPGTWWSGAERVAAAAEVRNAATCPVCEESRSALKPAAAPGRHATLGHLNDAAIDVVHRITNDPARLTRAWFDSALAGGLVDVEYVELVGIVVTVVSIDSFCRGLGVPLHPLPSPRDGPPSRYRPAAGRPDGAWVPMIPVGAARGAEADLWKPPRTGNVMRALSLVPDEVRILKLLSSAHYLTLEQVANPRAVRGVLSRAQVELIAARVSALRECFY